MRRLAITLLWMLALASAAGVAAQAAPEPAAYSVVVLEPAPLRDWYGVQVGQASAGQVLAWAGCQDRRRLWVELAPGRLAWLPPNQGAVFPGPPRQQQARLARLAAAKLAPEVRARLLAGRIAAGDSTWLVELAWGRPWRSYMVNLFRDEQHYLYHDPQGRKLLLRFKEGALVALPAQPSLAVAGCAPPR